MTKHNSDPNEIEKFNDLAFSDWWETQGACAPLHALNPLRMAFIQKHLQVSLAGLKILDVGCGGGILCEAMAKEGAKVTGIDLSENVLEIAKSHQLKSLQPENHIHYELMSVEALAEKHPHQFDVITCMEMLEHVPDPESIISACQKLLKPQGKIFLSTINRNPKAYLYAIIGAEWILKLLPKNTHEYAKFIRPSELSRSLRQQGFCVEALEGISYSPFSKQYALSADISVNYLLYAQKI